MRLGPPGASSRRSDSYVKYGIPLTGKKNVAAGVAEAVKMAGGEAVKKYVTEAPKKGDIKKRKLTVGSDAMRQRFVKKDGSGRLVARTMDEDDDGKPIIKKKHKRSKIDDVLGDDTY